MLDVSDTCCLLLPFNEKGEIGLDAIFDVKRISAIDYQKFARVLVAPGISHNPNQPGIRFLTDSNYTCLVRINGKVSYKLIIAEIKIADSPHRIALYRLTQEGQGKMVLVCGPYVDNGFHDARYQGKVFQGHSLDLTEKFIVDLEKRLLSRTSMAQLVAPSPALSFLKPPAAVSEPTTIPDPAVGSTINTLTGQ